MKQSDVVSGMKCLTVVGGELREVQVQEVIVDTGPGGKKRTRYGVKSVGGGPPLTPRTAAALRPIPARKSAAEVDAERAARSPRMAAVRAMAGAAVDGPDQPSGRVVFQMLREVMPRSVCSCGHLGDGGAVDPDRGAAAQHADAITREGRGVRVLGHGACEADPAHCPKFSWGRFTALTEVAVAAANELDGQGMDPAAKELLLRKIVEDVREAVLRLGDRAHAALLAPLQHSRTLPSALAEVGTAVPDAKAVAFGSRYAQQGTVADMIGAGRAPVPGQVQDEVVAQYVPTMGELCRGQDGLGAGSPWPAAVEALPTLLLPEVAGALDRLRLGARPSAEFTRSQRGVLPAMERGGLVRRLQGGSSAHGMVDAYELTPAGEVARKAGRQQ